MFNLSTALYNGLYLTFTEWNELTREYDVVLWRRFRRPSRACVYSQIWREKIRRSAFGLERVLLRAACINGGDCVCSSRGVGVGPQRSWGRAPKRWAGGGRRDRASWAHRGRPAEPSCQATAVAHQSSDESRSRCESGQSRVCVHHS